MKLRSLASTYGIALLLGVLALPATLHADSRIGLYTDQSGSTCSFSGNDPGLVTAYVVVGPDLNGVQAVRFSAPIPACFGSVFLSDTPTGVGAVTGQSPTGVQVAFQTCASYGEPRLALTITYYRNGSTTPCCAFPIEPDPLVGTIEVTDCSFNTGTMRPVVSHFNADASCPCETATPPLPPTNPDPQTGAYDVLVVSALGWQSSEPGLVWYDVYLGTNPTPGIVATITQPSYQPPVALLGLTQYYWRVVVRDIDGLETSGPTWTFTTRLANTPPSAPAQPNPIDNTTLVPISTTLQWVSYDLDGDALTYDVYFGTDPSPMLVASGIGNENYPVSSLPYSTMHYWKVVAHDSHGNVTQGPVWKFTSRPPNLPPSLSSPNRDVNSDVNTYVNTYHNAVFTWQSSDPDGDAITFDMYLVKRAWGEPPGTLNLVASNLGTSSFGPVELERSTLYYWRVVARDSHNATTNGPLWYFWTTPGSLPVVTSRTPLEGATNVSIHVKLTWSATDADGDELSYDVYFGPYAHPTKVASNITATTFDPGPLEYNKRYQWNLTLYDQYPNRADGDPDMHFTTESPPTAAGDLPTELALGRNHPNPFNPQTIIPYTVPKGAAMHLRIMVFDAAGRRVRTLVDETQSAGAREVIWRGENETGTVVSSGIYYCVMDAGGKRFTQKLVLLK